MVFVFMVLEIKAVPLLLQTQRLELVPASDKLLLRLLRLINLTNFTVNSRLMAN